LSQVIVTSNNGNEKLDLQAGELEHVETEINIRLQGVGLSLVNNEQGREIAYMAITR